MATSHSSTPSANAQNTLNSDVDLRGTLKCSGNVFFDGKLDGDLVTDGTLELGENATVRGNLGAASVLARGKINGNVSSRERLEVKAHTEIVGDLRAAKLIMEDDVVFQGKAEIAPAKSASSAKAPNPTYIPKPPDAYKATEIGKPSSR
jgi:cytoskeletal protein CcmA (bactofilin family)